MRYLIPESAGRQSSRLPPSAQVDELVVLVDDEGNPIGEQRKSSVHSARTPLHLAFSLYLFDDADRLLMTRRALSKLTWPGVWTNSCCGHPMPGEAIPDAIHRRLDAELGLQVTDLRCELPDFSYRVRDVSGIWENEICPVYVGRLSAAPPAATQGGSPPGVVSNVTHPNAVPRPNASEVMDWAWTTWDEIATAMAVTPFAFSPWAVQQVEELPGANRAGTSPNGSRRGTSA